MIERIREADRFTGYLLGMAAAMDILRKHQINVFHPTREELMDRIMHATEADVRAAYDKLRVIAPQDAAQSVSPEPINDCQGERV